MTLVLRLRAARRKAREAALAEMLAVLRGLDAHRSAGGPLSDQPGVAWASLPEPNLETALGRLSGLGYTEAVELVTPPGKADANSQARTKPIITRWKGRDVALVRVYEESDQSLRANAPDRRSFLLECNDGVVRTIPGYRGGRGPLEHRALPVVDARLLVNLVTCEGACPRLLDPFAGAGGIIIEANSKGFATTSLDCDSALRFGLNQLAARHVVGDASSMPFAAASFNAVASEPPYHASALAAVGASLAEIARVTRPGARVAMLIASEQAAALRQAATRAALRLELEVPIDRKGTPVSCLCWLR
ncbi:MAG: TRM11 family SAM-dependent methyltransferase [Candidatus Binatales bacterium]